MIDLAPIRARADLAAIARGYGMKLRRMGFQLHALCPFHDDRHTPSLVIHPEKQLFRCHGCGAEGDVFSFVRRMESLPGFRETAQRVAELAGVPLTDEPWTPAQKRDYARQRDKARQIALEAEQWWREIRAYLVRQMHHAYAADHEACAWMLANPEAPDTHPQAELAWLVADAVVPYAERLEKRIAAIDAADPDALVAEYLARRTPHLVGRLRARIEEAGRLGAMIVAIIAKATPKPEAAPATYTDHNL